MCAYMRSFLFTPCDCRRSNLVMSFGLCSQRNHIVSPCATNMLNGFTKRLDFVFSPLRVCVCKVGAPTLLLFFFFLLYFLFQEKKKKNFYGHVNFLFVHLFLFDFAMFPTCKPLPLLTVSFSCSLCFCSTSRTPPVPKSAKIQVARNCHYHSKRDFQMFQHSLVIACLMFQAELIFLY